VLEPAVAAGSSLVYAGDEPREVVLADWLRPGYDSFVAVANDVVLGAYVLRANYRGRGAHVANAGYVVAPAARGRGIARSLCEHSVKIARERGFRSIVFNYVVSTNAAALAVWKACGFTVVGTIPAAYSHRDAGLVDVHVMHRFV
jgi:ribosomal protein S18 acetylase RimI-like enzyme